MQPLNFGKRTSVLFCLWLVACGSPQTAGLEAADAMLSAAGVGTASFGSHTLRLDGQGASPGDTAFANDVRDAVLANPSLASQSASLASAQARLDFATARLRPQLSAGLAAGQDVGFNESDPSLDARLTLSQLVFDGASSRNRIALARIDQLQQSIELDVLLSSLSLQTANAWLEVWHQQTLEALAQDNVEAHRFYVDQTQMRAETGIGTGADLISARSRLSEAEGNLARTRSALMQADTAFFVLFERRPGVLPPPEMPVSLAAETARERLAASSLMAGHRIRLAAAMGQQDVVLSGRFPTVSLQLTGARTGVFSDSPENDAFVGFSVDQSLFSGGQQRASEREAASAVATAQRSLQNAQRDLTGQLETAIGNRIATAEELEAVSDATRFASQNLEAVRAQFEIGRRSFTDILDAQRELTAARTREAAVHARAISIEFAILNLTGDLSSVFGIAYDPFVVLQQSAANSDTPVPTPVGLIAQSLDGG